MSSYLDPSTLNFVPMLAPPSQMGYTLFSEVRSKWYTFNGLDKKMYSSSDGSSWELSTEFADNFTGTFSGMVCDQSSGDIFVLYNNYLYRYANGSATRIGTYAMPATGGTQYPGMVYIRADNKILIHQYNFSSGASVRFFAYDIATETMGVDTTILSVVGLNHTLPSYYVEGLVYYFKNDSTAQANSNKYLGLTSFNYGKENTYQALCGGANFTFLDAGGMIAFLSNGRWGPTSATTRLGVVSAKKTRTGGNPLVQGSNFDYVWTERYNSPSLPALPTMYWTQILDLQGEFKGLVYNSRLGIYYGKSIMELLRNVIAGNSIQTFGANQIGSIFQGNGQLIIGGTSRMVSNGPINPSALRPTSVGGWVAGG